MRNLEFKKEQGDWLKENLLKKGYNLTTIKTKFCEHYQLEKMSINVFKQVLASFEIDLKRDNKKGFAHDKEEFNTYVKSLLQQGLSKAKIYDITCEKYPCSLVHFNDMTKGEIDWRKDNAIPLKITILD